MRILFVPQIANRSYTTRKWILLKDGHIRMIKNQIMALSKEHEDWQFDVALPTIDHIEDIKSYDELFFEPSFLGKKNVNVIPISTSKNVAYNRFHFDMNELIENKLDYDLILTDIPETARNFKMYFNLAKKPVKIISNCHYLDIYQENQITQGTSNYFWRQIDGMLVSDHVTFLTAKMKDDFLNYADNFVTHKIVTEIYNKSSILDFMIFSEEELHMYMQEKDPVKTIFFISRCSDEKRTKWRFFIRTIKQLRNYRQDFKVVIANPTDIIDDELVKEIGGVDYITVPTNFSRKDYIEQLWKSYCVPLLYDIDNNLSVGFYEAMYCDNIPVQFGIDFEDLAHFESTLFSYLSEMPMDPFIARKHKIIEERSSEFNSKNFNNFITNIIHG